MKRRRLACILLSTVIISMLGGCSIPKDNNIDIEENTINTAVDESIVETENQEIADNEETPEHVGEHIDYSSDVFTIDTWIPFFEKSYDDAYQVGYNYATEDYSAAVSLYASYVTDYSTIDSYNKSVQNKDENNRTIIIGSQSLIAYTTSYEHDNNVSQTLWIPLSQGGISINIYYQNQSQIAEIADIKNAVDVWINSLKVDENYILDEPLIKVYDPADDVFISMAEKERIEAEKLEAERKAEEERIKAEEAKRLAEEKKKPEYWAKLPSNPREWPDSKLLEYYNVFGHYPPNFDPFDG